MAIRASWAMIAHIDRLFGNHYISMTEDFSTKPIIWVGSSKRSFDGFPLDVKSDFGHALYMAQIDDRHYRSKMMTSLQGVIEIVQAYRGDAFRVVYTVRFASAIYVLHVFQKKSKSGISTPLFEMDLVKRRLRDAEIIEKGRGT